jgi:hypothetical protein
VKIADAKMHDPGRERGAIMARRVGGFGDLQQRACAKPDGHCEPVLDREWGPIPARAVQFIQTPLCDQRSGRRYVSRRRGARPAAMSVRSHAAPLRLNVVADGLVRLAKADPLAGGVRRRGPSARLHARGAGRRVRPAEWRRSDASSPSPPAFAACRARAVAASLG